jgi:hypothetical protein
MESVALYARIPRETKDEVERFAGSRGLTLASGVQTLLDAGLRSEDDTTGIGSLSLQVTDLQHERDREVAARRQAEAELNALRDAGSIWSKRAGTTVGECPDCARALSGTDLLILGACPECGRSVADLLAPTTQSSLNDKDLLLVLGAAGLLLGAIALAGKAGGR